MGRQPHRGTDEALRKMHGSKAGRLGDVFTPRQGVPHAERTCQVGSKSKQKLGLPYSQHLSAQLTGGSRHRFSSCTARA
eukprot:857136-Pelagomonas_calceolata.AAC.3